MWRERAALDRETAHLGLFNAGGTPQREVILPDERTQVADTLALPFRWICHLRITYQDPGQRYKERTRGGSGVLIGGRHVLTAAHVLISEDGRGPARAVTVYPARSGTRAAEAPFGGIAASGWEVSPDWRRNGRSNRNFDYGVITLASAVSTRTHRRLAGPLRYWGHTSVRADAIFARAEPATLQGLEATVAGYPGDKPAGTMWVAGGVLEDVPPAGRLLRHTVDTEEGQSGAPVWWM